MKARQLILVTIGTLLFSVNVFAGCCGDGTCHPYETKCQCTDISCNTNFDGDCLSRSECCEAFGNVGAR